MTRKDILQTLQKFSLNRKQLESNVNWSVQIRASFHDFQPTVTLFITSKTVQFQRQLEESVPDILTHVCESYY